MIAQPTHEVVSMIGVSFCSLNHNFQIQDLEIYFDQNEPMNSMAKVQGSPVGLPAKGKTPGGVDVEVQQMTPPVSPRASRGATRGLEQAAPQTATGSGGPPVRAPWPLKKQISAESDDFDESGKGILGGIWEMLRPRS